MALAKKIVELGLSLGLSQVGIIRPGAMEGYGDRVRERLAKTPEATFLEKLIGFSRVTEQHPWAKAIVVATMNYTRYKLPPGPPKHFGKSYLVDNRRNPQSPDAIRVKAFTAAMADLGLKVAHDEHPGVTGMRWAAMSAGLGQIRRNNFFYGQNGSFMAITAWLIDRELEFLYETPQKPCAESCRRCLNACPTGSLSAPFTMDMTRCVSFLTTVNDDRVHDPQTRKAFGSWVYGCDACQDACPHDKGQWDRGSEDFPNLSALAKRLSPLAIIRTPYADVANFLAPKFFYLKPDYLWRWKYNALNALENLGQIPEPNDLRPLLSDENDQVRRLAHNLLG